MKCKVCGNESGKYPLCKDCNKKKEQGLIIKCADCGKWHEKTSLCSRPEANNNTDFLYEVKKALISENELEYFSALKESVPEGYNVFPQINLAAFIERTDDARFRNELFRNVDFLITDRNYKPMLAVEINDSTHLEKDRKERDLKVGNILEEAGIPLLNLWTSYGVKTDYIKNKIDETLNSPVVRKKHSSSEVSGKKKTQGCYIATCVYGSYDCPSVWTLRRYRDEILDRSLTGRLFIRCYYALSPHLVRAFGDTKLFRHFWKKHLDRLVARLNRQGIKNTAYSDKY